MTKHIPSIDDLLNLKVPVPDDISISPDGRQVAYVVRSPNWDENQYISQIWVTATDPHKPNKRQITFAQQSSSMPRWSPDSTQLCFLSKRNDDKATQIYRLNLGGGEAERLTDSPTDISQLLWSPDGKAIAFFATEPETAEDKDRKKRYGDYAIEDVDFRFQHLWVYELASGTTRRLISGKTLHVTEAEWKPDSSALVFGASASPDINHVLNPDLYVIEVESGIVWKLTETAYNARWSPDGARIAFMRSHRRERYLNNRLFISPAVENATAQPINYDFDENIYLNCWRDEGIFFTAIIRAGMQHFRMDPHDYQISPLIAVDERGWLSFTMSLSADSKMVAMVATHQDHFYEVVIVDRENRQHVTLTDFDAQLKDFILGQHELIQWQSSDGTHIEGVLTKPHDFDPNQKYPLLVVIHGGPTWISPLVKLDNYHRYGYPVHQWAGKGALILQPNYRGSAGYGEAFRSLNVRQLGVGDYEDVSTGVDALIEKGWVDPERLGAMGWSQGGYISAYITTNSDRFKAVSVGAGISNWMTYYVNTDIHDFTHSYLQATPWDDPEIFRLTSPISNIRQARTPTLIQHGDSDRRVPVPNAYELYQGLKDVGVETRLVIYKGMGHSYTGPNSARQGMEENFNWFNRFIWGEDPEQKTAVELYVALSSAKQSDDAGKLPALERFTAPRIAEVHRFARRDGARFCILSGSSGLIASEDLLHPDNHSMQVETISSLAPKIADQLWRMKITRIVVFTSAVPDNYRTLIYVGCLQIAAGMVGGIQVEHREMSGPNW